MGLPIRIPAVTFTYNYPQRFAVRRVLHRLLVPRHPLCALISLTLHFHSSTTFLSTFQRSLLEKLLVSQNCIRLSIFFHFVFSCLFILLRKEVIHPHLPVGIPCYDLTPIICPTLDGSFLAVRPPASGITNSHGLTGGVYKARERIHRDMADSRLLAIPASCSRVADYNPN